MILNEKNPSNLLKGWTRLDGLQNLQKILGGYMQISAREAGNVGINAPSPDPVIEQLVAELRRRSAVGLKKYGAPLSREDLSLKDWLQHALEETLDNAGYLQCAINKVEKSV